MTTTLQKITFGKMRASSVRDVLSIAMVAAEGCCTGKSRRD
jgi:hypothetical protein